MTEPHRGESLKDIYDRIIANAVDVGALKAKQDALGDRMTTLEKSIKDGLDSVSKSQTALDEKIDCLIQSQQNLTGKFEGGWKVLTVVGGLAVAIGGLFAWIVDKWAAIKGVIL